MRFRFGGFVLDDESFRLTRGGSPVALRRKVFDLLVVLVRERERVVPREELVGRLWSTTAVGAGSLSGLVNELRGALDEGSAGRSSIRTVHARGYQFVAPVELAPLEGAQGVQAPVDPPGAGVQSGHGGRETLERARRAVGQSGARALVAAVADPATRASWLAHVLAEARGAGFQARWETLDQAGAGGEGVAPGSEWGSAFPGQEARDTPFRPPADGPRMPIALGLDVPAPGAWSRAGGLSRLLDLLGRAPVLVIAGLALPEQDDWIRTLLGRDARIELVGAFEAGDAPMRWRGEGAALVAPTGDRLTGILRALARPDEAAFVAALRALGFEPARLEPIRSVRRVDPASLGADHRRGSERI